MIPGVCRLAFSAWLKLRRRIQQTLTSLTSTIVHPLYTRIKQTRIEEFDYTTGHSSIVVSATYPALFLTERELGRYQIPLLYCALWYS